VVGQLGTDFENRRIDLEVRIWRDAGDYVQIWY
jgi:hypothetical protein